MIQKGTKSIETGRLLLRNFEKNDVESFFSCCGSRVILGQYMSWTPHGNIKITKRILDIITESYKNDTYNWAIVSKNRNEVIGSIFVKSLFPEHKCCEIGYYLCEDFWGKGLMTEAVVVVVKFLFNEVGVHRVQAFHDIQNIASERVLQKSGFRLEGTMRHNRIRKDGSFSDVNIWAILNEEG
ncbi:MAG: GNAT family N-acetyltransferase [Ruminiclostridium sp.]|nr:GNAT family N-acetyltransferase [Ruminiclostridium sp.]